MSVLAKKILAAKKRLESAESAYDSLTRIDCYDATTEGLRGSLDPDGWITLERGDQAISVQLGWLRDVIRLAEKADVPDYP